MLKLLIKKQLMEVFRTYFYDAKKNKKRSTPAVICFFLLFFVLVFGLLGFIFWKAAELLCPALLSLDMGWMYFILMAGISIVMGAFGSVFNTFSGLYLSKDNDLLLSMPIPTSYIILSRLFNVYILGAVYSAAAFFPALLVYWINADMHINTAAKIICGLLMFFTISIIVLILSCVLGLVVAKISTKLKRKNFLTVFLSLLFIGGYYFIYFKASSLLSNILTNALMYGEKIKNSAYGLLVFGTMGEGNIKSTVIVIAIILACLAVTMFILSKTFLNISTSSSGTKKKTYKSVALKENSVRKAVLLKEFARFTSSPNYMLNCGLGVVMIPIIGILFLVKGELIMTTAVQVFAGYYDFIYVMICTALCVISTLNSSAAPSVSLEGKNLWIAQSIPVKANIILRSKMLVQLIISAVPVLFTAICAAIVIDAPVSVKLFMIVLPLIYCVYSASMNTFLSMKFPNFSWTNELVPIKQSACVAIAIFSGWALSGLFALIYYFVMDYIGAVTYLSVLCLVLVTISAVIINWLEGKGAREFEKL